MSIKKNKKSLKISVIGDSFSADTTDNSWVSLLAGEYTVQNYSQRGISEYRIFDIIQNNYKKISNSDYIIIFHTLSDRVFIPDHVDYPTRSIQSHPYCDMVASDSLNNEKWNDIAKTYYKYFFDSEMQAVFYKLLIEKINAMFSNTSIINCSGFDNIVKVDSVEIQSFFDIKNKHPGNINHFDKVGNQEVYKYITKLIDNENI